MKLSGKTALAMILATLLAGPVLDGGAQASPASPAAPAAGSTGSPAAGAGPAAGAAASGSAPTGQLTDAERDAKRRDTLRYGIESEISDLLKTLDSEKEGKFNDDILALFRSSRNSKLRTSILDFFSDLEWKGAEEDALALVATRDRNDQALVASALAYLAQIRSKAALEYAQAIMKDEDKKLLPGVIRLIGRAGGPDEEDLLIGWMATDSATDDLKQSAMRALGDLGSRKAVEKLRKIAEDGLQGKANRMTACDALGRIGDPAAIPSLVTAANSDDPNVRSSAVAALASFRDADALAAIQSALRDSVALVRIAACKACAKLRLVEAVPAIIYKASNDPEKAVKTEAMKSLADLGGSEGFAFLRTYLAGPKNDTALRILAFGLLLRKDPASMDTLKERLVAEGKEKDRSLYTSFVREIANSPDTPWGLPLAKILFSDSDYLIRVGGLEWAKRNKGGEVRAELEQLASKDPSDYIRKRAAEILASF
jgi:HEAT repeat protein